MAESSRRRVAKRRLDAENKEMPERQRVRSLISVVKPASQGKEDGQTQQEKKNDSEAVERKGSEASSDQSASSPKTPTSSNRKSPPGKSPGSDKGSRTKKASSKVQDLQKARNRRFFGGLMGHLARASSELKSPNSQESLAKKAERHKEVLRKQEEESRRLLQERKDKQEREKEERIQAALKREHHIVASKIKQMAKVWIAHQQVLGDYLITSASSPPLLWKPTKHNAKTENMIQQRKEALSADCEERQKKFDAEIRAIYDEHGQPDSEKSHKVETSSDAEEPADNKVEKQARSNTARREPAQRKTKKTTDSSRHRSSSEKDKRKHGD